MVDGKWVEWSQKGVISTKWFRLVGMDPSTVDLDESDNDNDPFASEELLHLEALVQNMSSKKGIGIAPNAAIHNNTDTYHSLDTSDHYRRGILWDEVITPHSNSDKTEMEAGPDRWYSSDNTLFNFSVDDGDCEEPSTAVMKLFDSYSFWYEAKFPEAMKQSGLHG